MASRRGELRGKHPVAAAEVQDALTGARREQFNHGRAKFGDEAGVASVAFRIPLPPVPKRDCFFLNGKKIPYPRRLLPAENIYFSFAYSALAATSTGISLAWWLSR
jgi:hypothetical protein